MKAKRIVSILLTGSMLLSLLPVSALAAAPVFDAPAQTTAKKAAPLVQEADASRSTEEEAATRSSRDLDAENGTADSITIDLNADGTPAGSGDSGHWECGNATSFNLHLQQGTFTLQPSSEPGAISALQADLYILENAKFNGGTVGDYTYNYGTISDGTFQGDVNNYNTISNGTFQRMVFNNGTISGGSFLGDMNNWGTISGGIFLGGGTTTKPSPAAPSKGWWATPAPSPAVPSKRMCTTTAPSPTVPSKGRWSTTKPSPAAPLRKLSR